MRGKKFAVQYDGNYESGSTIGRTDDTDEFRE